MMVPVSAMAPALEERVIGRLLDQSVLEDVLGGWRQPPLVEELCLDESAERLSQALLIRGRKRLEKLVAELSSQYGADLGDLFRITEPIETRHERALQCRWDLELLDRLLELVVPVLWLQVPGLEEHPRQLFHE